MSLLLAEGDHHGLTTSTSLGLTCRSFYGILKALHPMPVPLVYRSKNRWEKTSSYKVLHDTVGEFLGSGYRGTWITPRGQNSFHFLNKDTYGRTRGLAQRRLHERIACCQRIEVFRTGYQVGFRIPRPNGKGDEWYAEILTFLDNLDMTPWTQEMVKV